MANSITRMQNPSHPGRILAHFLDGRTVTEVAAHLGVPRRSLAQVLNCRAGVTADLALRLAEAFKTEPELWLRLQVQYDLWIALKQQRRKVKPFETGLAA